MSLCPALPFLCAYFTRIASIAGDAGVLYMAQRPSCESHELSKTQLSCHFTCQGRYSPLELPAHNLEVSQYIEAFIYHISLFGVITMSRVCQVTGKRPVSGNNVSHAHNKTRRRFLPNLHTHRFWVESENRHVKLRVTANGMRIIDKKGIDVVLSEMRSRGEKV